MADTIDLISSSGITWTLDLPLSPALADQFERGELRPVDLPSEADDDGRPDENAKKAVWVDYVTSLGADPDFVASATKAQLVAFEPSDPDVSDPEDEPEAEDDPESEEDDAEPVEAPDDDEV